VADRFRAILSEKSVVLGKLLDVVCALLTAAGVLAGAAILYSIWSTALGTWIS
jgi:hypothetical protein